MAGNRDADIAVLATGAIFHGAYEVVRCIKAGGMGAVYEVLQNTTERRRALKVMLPSLVSDPEMRARFELEAKVAAGIESEHIVETLDAGVDEATGMPFIVMELLKGEEIGALLKVRKRLPPEEVVTLLHQAALALDRTHAAGIVHRDLKPENLFLTRRDDGSPRLKILDFGVAKIVADGTASSNTTKSVGSPLYMAPEQIAGDPIGPHVDRYSLAHIAFTMLVGKPYWARERKSAQGLYPYLMLVARGAQVSASERAKELGVSLPEAFDAWFSRATALDTSVRFDGSVTMIAALGEAFDVKPPAASAPPPGTRAILPSIVLEPARELPLSQPPPADAAITATAPPIPPHVAAIEASGASPLPSSLEPPSESTSPGADPSAPALTRSSGEPLSSPPEPRSRRRSSVSPIFALLLLVVGVGAVGAALAIWPKGAPFATLPTAVPTPTPALTASSPAPAAVLPAALATAEPMTHPEPAPSASTVPAPEPAPSSSAATPAASAAPTSSDKPVSPLPSTSGWNRGKPAGTGTSKTPSKGKNPLDEY
ncbi:serine/threonine protein kinase [Polyangium jinanense]|uniref:non-specific serine/threonine protein kinase n=1 Tax=Polyangium jinanense TaxID=2829994 RepID=A0A9X4ASM2_9BACT|nr:protein kinase [Polyangium jinanense]MDC3954955.1 protein kinase [Polyangium jinanense]MDC3981275.1 protein kinase [Polyangium jinanense]